MRKLATLSLLALFLLNLAGYRLLLNYAQLRSDARLVAALDKNQYNESDLITIEIPLSLPYLTDWKDFERVDGELILHGKIYKYVKRTISHNKLILKCLPDNKKMQLETAKNDFFNNTSDISQNPNVKLPGIVKSICKNSFSDYDKAPSLQITCLNASLQSCGDSRTADDLLHTPHILPEQPPDGI